jgi:DNA-directed RNA polymerase subunit M/transcription elongation factor TFIIS
MFCPKCGSMGVVQKKRFVCPKCKEEIKGGAIKEKVPKGKEIEIADGSNPVAVHDHICSRCGYDKAEIIDKGIWYSDEDNVIVFKCGRCGHSEMGDAKVT